MASGEAEGAELYQPACELPERGFWFPPTVFTNVAQSFRIAQEEIFGPVLSVLTFRTPDEAVAKANNTPYGLSAGAWTEKGSRILWMANQLRAGVVWANTFNKFDPTSPFGGYKESGYGREGGLHGVAGVLARGVRGVREEAALAVVHGVGAAGLRAGEGPVDVQLVGLADLQALAHRGPRGSASAASSFVG